MIRLSILACLFLAAGSGDVAPTNDGDDVDFYLHGILNDRQLLRSGMYTANGIRSVAPKGFEQSAFNSEVSLFCAFDVNRLRLDNTEEMFIASQTKTALVWDKKLMRRRYFRTTSESAVWLEDQGAAWISRADAAMVGTYLFLDPRALGATTFKYVADSNGSTLEKTIKAYLNNGRAKSVAMLDDGLVQLIFATDVGAKREELRLWVAADKGFTVTRLESRTRMGDRDDSEWRINETANVSWKEISGVWLPTVCEMKEMRRDGEQTLSLTFDWQSVNQDIDSTYFTLTGIDAPDTAKVVDVTGPNPIVIHDPREKKIEYIDSYLLKGLFIAANVAIIGLLVFFYLRKRRRVDLAA